MEKTCSERDCRKRCKSNERDFGCRIGLREGRKREKERKRKATAVTAVSVCVCAGHSQSQKDGLKGATDWSKMMSKYSKDADDGNSVGGVGKDHHHQIDESDGKYWAGHDNGINWPIEQKRGNGNWMNGKTTESEKERRDEWMDEDRIKRCGQLDKRGQNVHSKNGIHRKEQHIWKVYKIVSKRMDNAY